MKKNEYLLSVTEVKNILKQQSTEELIELIIDSYKTIPQLKEYITVKYSNEDTIEQIFKVYKDKVHDVFFPKSMKTQFKIGDAKKVVNDFKKLCLDEKLVIELMLYYVEMGVAFTNAYGDINESFYNNVESMYEAIVKSINKHKNSEIFVSLRDRLKNVVDNTSEMGWGFHDVLEQYYAEIKWLELEDASSENKELIQIKEYIADRIGKRNDLPDFDEKISINTMISEIIDADEAFILRMDEQGENYSNDDEYDFISEKTGYSVEITELILWQKYCYEMEHDYWQYDEGKCSKCGSSELYIREVPNEDFEDQVICKICGTEFKSKL